MVCLLKKCVKIKNFLKNLKILFENAKLFEKFIGVSLRVIYTSQIIR